MEKVIEVANLSKKYTDFALKNINFTVPKGMIIGLIGENGAGKTTTIKSILNLITRDSGNIKIFGLDNQKDEKKIKEEIGVVLNDSYLAEELTPMDINNIMKRFYRKWDQSLFFQYLTNFKLPKDKPSKDYSTGMKMKLAIATALSHHPKLLILDEPTSGLDPVARCEILEIFQEFIQEEDHSILVSSHITTDLEHIADYIVFIQNGEIIFQKTTDELLENYGIVKCREEEFQKIEKEDYIQYKKKKYEINLLVSDKRKFQKKYNNIEVIDKPTIEDIMLLYIKGGK